MMRILPNHPFLGRLAHAGRVVALVAASAAAAGMGANEASAQSIVAAEYFIDEDPGPGNGIPVVVEPATTSASLVIDVPASVIAALTPGLHRLACRVRDETGEWSTASARSFHKSDPAPPVQPLVERIEYQWLSDDLPVGEPIAIVPDAPAVDVSLTRLASLAGLTAGESYRLVVTPFDSRGVRGFSEVSPEIRIETIDSDGDGVPDLWESANGFNPNNASDMADGSDADGDGLDNRTEFTLGTNPRAVDTDADGLDDRAEIGMTALGFDPLVPSTDLLADLRDHAEAAGLYRRDQLQAIALGKPLLERSLPSGLFTLRIALSRSTDLADFAPFPFTDQGTTVNAFGEIEFTFDAGEEDVAFFSLEAE